MNSILKGFMALAKLFTIRKDFVPDIFAIFIFP